MSDIFSSHFNLAWLTKLMSTPEQVISGIFSNTPYKAHIVIPHYKLRISEYYRDEIDGNLDQLCTRLNLPKVFKHFGVSIFFEKPIQLHLHDSDMSMVNGLHPIIKEIGAVIIKNAYLDSEHRDMGHKNRFPQLNFHVDRSEKQPTHYSMYTRNPYDDEQKHPRKSSTLFAASIIGYLQSVKEKTIDPHSETGNKGTYTIFTKENMSDVINKIIIEHAWNETIGTGEISMLDNITCLHASYYPMVHEKGYKIGVRYVA